MKLIAEPWDVGPGGYQVGQLPGRLGGVERQVPRLHPPLLARRQRPAAGELASRLSGSSDLYASSGRRTYASVNFITAHDGFTLNDLVSYERKHNEANGEDNRDGHNDNIRRNWGVGGRHRRPPHPPHCASA